MPRMKTYTAYFTDGTDLDFEAASDLAAREYSDYRAKLRGQTTNYITDEKRKVVK